MRKRAGRFEVRENLRTERGPRARTLATFAQLTPEVVAQARERAQRPLDEADLRRSAHRAGATVTGAPVDAAAAQLYEELSSGARLRPALARLIAAEIAVTQSPSDAERAAGQWLGRSQHDRGVALRDLLALTDRLPVTDRGPTLGFPPLGTP